MKERTTTLTDRIAFAEGWLGRAKRQIEGGHTTGGTLTLLLAEAELHRAREVCLPLSAPPRPRPARSWLAWTAAGLAAIVAALLVMLQMMVPAAAPVDSASAPPIVTLAREPGEMLRFVTVPAPVIERTVVRSTIVRLPALPPIRHEPPTIVVSAPQPPVAAPPAPPQRPVVQAPAAPPAPEVVAAPAPSLLSDADVIDLVLAAERSLRRSANQ